jgi:hypothetical protein
VGLVEAVDALAAALLDAHKPGRLEDAKVPRGGRPAAGEPVRDLSRRHFAAAVPQRVVTEVHRQVSPERSTRTVETAHAPEPFLKEGHRRREPALGALLQLGPAKRRTRRMPAPMTIDVKAAPRRFLPPPDGILSLTSEPFVPVSSTRASERLSGPMRSGAPKSRLPPVKPP